MMSRVKLEYLFWKLFNLLVRLMGLIWLLGGIIGLMRSIEILFPHKNISVNHTLTNDPILKIIVIFVYLLCAILGVLMIRVKGFYPEKIKEWKKNERSKNKQP